MSVDIHNNMATELAFDTATIATDTTTAGNIIDTRNYDGLEFVIQTVAWTDGAYDVLIEDGDAANLSDAAAVADVHLLGTEAIALGAADLVAEIGYKMVKRYVRLSIVSTGTTSGADLNAVAVKTALRVPV